MVRFDKVTKSYGALTVLDSLDLDVARGREGGDHRPLGFRQDHRAAHADDARDDQRRRYLGRRRAADACREERRDGAGRPAPSPPHPRQDRHGLPALQPLSPHDGAEELHGGAVHRAEAAEAGSGGARARTPRHGGARRQAEPLSEPTLRRPAAARRLRPRARHATEGHAARRGHLGARSRARRRGAERHPQARLASST